MIDFFVQTLDLPPLNLVAQVRYQVPWHRRVPKSKGSGGRNGESDTDISIYAPPFSQVVNPNFLIESTAPKYRVTVVEVMGKTVYDRTFVGAGTYNLIRLANVRKEVKYRLTVTVPGDSYHAKVTFQKIPAPMEINARLKQVSDPKLIFSLYYERNLFVDAISYLFENDKSAFLALRY